MKNTNKNDFNATIGNTVLGDVHIGFAVHSLPLIDQPLCRFDNIELERAKSFKVLNG